jgi:fatty acid desaturase
MKRNDANDLEFSVDPKALKPLFETKVYRHVRAMLFDWVIIFATIYACNQFFNPITYLLAVIIVGARMHALAILMHDASHFRFLKNRKMNDLVTNLFTMYPLFTSIEKYRDNHMRHHRHLNSDHDPDWVAKLTKREFRFPKTKAEFILTILSYLVFYQGVLDAVWFLKRFQSAKGKSADNASHKRDRLLFTVVLFTILTVAGLWKYYLLYWVVPYLTTFFMFQYIRSVAEHFGELAYDHILTSSRTIKPNWIERFFMSPHNVGYHLEHHLYPGVPFYHLPKLHRLLMTHREYQGKAHITQGYMSGLLNELGKAS